MNSVINQVINQVMPAYARDVTQRRGHLVHTEN
jgi:hypothetical protein